MGEGGEVVSFYEAHGKLTFAFDLTHFGQIQVCFSKHDLCCMLCS